MGAEGRRGKVRVLSLRLPPPCYRLAASFWESGVCPLYPGVGDLSPSPSSPAGGAGSPLWPVPERFWFPSTCSHLCRQILIKHSSVTRMEREWCLLLPGTCLAGRHRLLRCAPSYPLGHLVPFPVTGKSGCLPVHRKWGKTESLPTPKAGLAALLSYAKLPQPLNLGDQSHCVCRRLLLVAVG